MTKPKQTRGPEPKASRPHMPGYGLLDAKGGRGLLPWSWATERMVNARRYWLATTKPDGRPHVMPVWGVWLDGTFYFSTGRQSQKARNLVANPQCVVCSERADEAVIVEGVVSEVTARTQLKPFAEAYKTKYGWDMESGEEPVYSVLPRVGFGFIENADDFPGTATRWVFENK